MLELVVDKVAEGQKIKVKPGSFEGKNAVYPVNVFTYYLLLNTRSAPRLLGYYSSEGSGVVNRPSFWTRADPCCFLLSLFSSEA